jgi:hypothetical protein
VRGSFERSEAKRTIRSSAAAASQTALLIRWPRVRALSPARVRVSASSLRLVRGDCVDARRRPRGSAAAGLRHREDASSSATRRGCVSRPKVTLMFTPSCDPGATSVVIRTRAGRRRRARPWAPCGAAARPRPRAAPTCRRARSALTRGPAPPRRPTRRDRGRGRSRPLLFVAPRARPPRARAGPGPVLFFSCLLCFCDFVTL